MNATSATAGSELSTQGPARQELTVVKNLIDTLDAGVAVYRAFDDGADFRFFFLNPAPAGLRGWMPTK